MSSSPSSQPAKKAAEPSASTTSSPRTALQVRHANISAGRPWFSFVGMECCPVECSGFGGVSLPCGAPADGEQLNVESVTSSEVAARLQVRACKGCSGRCGADALLRAFPRGHLLFHRGSSTSIVDFANQAVYERYAAMEEEAFIASVCAGVPRLCSDTHPTIREVFEYIGALEEESSSSGSQGPTLSGTAHPLATYATEAARRLTKRLRALERAASRLKRHGELGAPLGADSKQEMEALADLETFADHLPADTLKALRAAAPRH